MMRWTVRWTAAAAVALGVTLAGCGGGGCSGGGGDELPADLDVSEPDAEIVAAHTEGVISRREPVRVRFVDEVVSSTQVGSEADPAPLFVEPHTAGTVTWDSTRELVFTPDGDLTPGSSLRFTIDLGEIREAWAGEAFAFDVDVMEQAYWVELAGTSIDAADGSTQKLTGTLRTADVAADEAVENVVSATYDGQPVDVSWTHLSESKAHSFTITGLQRGEQDDRELVVTFDGAPLGVDTDREERATIPSLQRFELASARAVTGAERYIELRFSDPIDPEQDLSGLVTVDGHDQLRAVVDGSVVRVYTTSTWSAEETVRIEGLRNALGRQLSDALTQTVHFAAMKPEVRFAGDGVILPTTSGLTVPIEVVNLTGLTVEAMRVYDSNVPQFLQVNPLDGDEQMQRVGTVVWRERVALDRTPDQQNRWVRVGLDVGELVEDHPRGLYHLRLTFDRRDIDYDCATPPPERPEGPERPLNPDWESGGGEDSFWDAWGEGADGMSHWELYENRNDPCHPGYYTEQYDHDIVQTRNVMVSDLGLLTKQGEDGGILVVATDLQTAEPRPGVAVRVLDYQLQELAVGTTDSMGQVRVRTADDPFVVTAVDGDDAAWIKLARGSSLALSHFDTSGAEVQEGVKGFFYGERGVWRPGDDIHLMFVAHDTTGGLPEDHPVHFELRDPRGQVVERRTVPGGLDGFYDLRTSTPPDAPTGPYLARVALGGRTFDKALRVETVVPNRLKIDLDFGTELLTADDLAIDATLNSRWLHGAVARNLEASIDVRLAPKTTRFERFGDFTFDDPLAQWSTETTELWSGRLDSEGSVPVKAPVQVGDGAPGLLSATFLTRVFEPSGAASVDEATLTVSPHERYVGIATPEGDAARGMLLTDQEHPVRIATVDAEGNATGDGTVEVKMYKVRWRWWWETGADDDLAGYVGSDSATLVSEGTVDLTDGEGTWEFQIDYPQWGRYLIVASDSEGTHRAGKIVYVDWPGWAGRGQGDSPGGASVLSVTTDDDSVQVGDEVTLNIPTARGGRALVTLESGTKVLRAAWVQPEGDTTRYSFRATPDMAPGVYAHVTLVQPHLGDNDLPVRLYGIVPVDVVDPATKLEPTVQTADVLEPEATARITVGEAEGRAMTYTLAVVDEGLLGLTRFQTPDPWGTFYAREALGVRTWDLFDQVMGGVGGALESRIAIGGDGEADAPPPSRANRFPPVVEVLGPFSLPAGEDKVHEVDLPPYVGEVRVMVVAGHDGAFGSVDRSVPVRKPLMVLATLPRVLGPQERVALPVSVFALEEKVRNAKVTVTTEGPLELVSDGSQSVAFPTPGDQMALFDLQVEDQLGVGRVTVVAEGGGERAEQTIEIDVRHPGTRVIETVAGTAKAGQTWTADVQLPGLPGTNEVTLELSRVPPLNLGERLDGLIRYPHGCVEQTTSGAFPQVALASVVELSPQQQGSVDRNIRAGIDRIRRFQTASGGFGYWPGHRAADDWSTSYAGHFLLEAERAGYLVDGEVRRRWVDYQRNAANRFTGEGSRADLVQAYRLYTLALAGAPELGAMNRLREARGISLAARWRLAAAYHLAGQPEVARELASGQGIDVKPYTELSNTYGSDLRDEAMILETLVLLGDTDQALSVARTLSEALSSDRGMSTQTTAYALIAMSRFATAAGTGDAIDVRYAVGDRGEQTVSSNKAVVQVPLPSEGGTLTLTNAGSGVVFPRVILAGLPPIGTEQPSSNVLKIDVSYRYAEGGPVSVRRLDHGTDLVATVKVTNTGASELPELALSHIVPSGWEIHGEASGTGSGYDYRDVRDDRVYTYFDLPPAETRTFTVKLNASYRGKYYLPPVAVEAMYDPTLHARTAGRWVQVVLPGPS